MTYTTAADDAASIRQAYKARGWTSKQISVRSEYFSGGSAINVIIKDGSIPLGVVKSIAEGKERIHRCEITGEILSGANRYVSVRYTEQALIQLSLPYVEDVKVALGKLATADHNVLIPVAGTPYFVGREANPGNFALWGETSHLAGYLNSPETIAAEIGRRMLDA